MSENDFDLDRAIYDHLWYEAKFGKLNQPIPIEEISEAISKRFKVDITPADVEAKVKMTGYKQIDAQGIKHNIPPYHFRQKKEGGNPQVMTHVFLAEQAVNYPAEWAFKPYP